MAACRSTSASGSLEKVIGDRNAAPIAFDPDGQRLAVQVHENGGIGVDVWPVGANGAIASGPRFPGVAQIFTETVRFAGSKLRFFAKRETDLVRVEIP